MAAERLQKLIAATGLCSRRRAEDLLRAGRVCVNGERASLGDRADPSCDAIRIDGQPLAAAAAPLLLLLNKPLGVLCSCRDPRGRPTVLDLLPPELQQGQGLHPVGRLDAESRGALLLTNQGELTLRLTHPRYGHTKTYRVWVAGQPDPESNCGAGRRGCRWRRGPAQPVGVTLLRRRRDRSLLELEMGEGRNRQIRRTAALLGHPVLDLQRVAIGPLAWPTCRKGSGATSSTENGNPWPRDPPEPPRPAPARPSLPPLAAGGPSRRCHRLRRGAPHRSVAGGRSTLREARERRGLGLRQLAQQTRISTPVLEALERGWRDRLPESTYLRTMLPLIERHLELDPGSLQKLLPSERYRASGCAKQPAVAPLHARLHRCVHHLAGHPALRPAHPGVDLCPQPAAAAAGPRGLAGGGSPAQPPGTNRGQAATPGEQGHRAAAGHLPGAAAPATRPPGSGAAVVAPGQLAVALKGSIERPPGPGAARSS
jgi:16S rRNA pseudouridine516 synthase